MKRYKIGVIGCGARGETFARTLYEGMARAELFGVCDIDADRLEKFCSYCELDGARRFTDPAAFFGQREMDAVIITTPDFTHRDVALQAIAAGKPFYLEKPMDVTLEHCREIRRAARERNVPSLMGFCLRLGAGYMRMKEYLDSGLLGQIVHIEGLEHVGVAHGAAFMRRFHRYRAQSGGFLNTKSSHDMDILQWLIGHEHKLKRVAAFGGCNVLVPQKAPAKYCHECPRRGVCPYEDRAGFVFPVNGRYPIHHRDTETYGGDLCVYNDEKDICDNMTAIFEWDNGIRGNFNLQLFNAPNGVGRWTKIFGEKGVMEYGGGKIVIRQAPSGNLIEITPRGHEVIHGKGDPQMIGLFIDAIEGKCDPTMGLDAGLSAAILALKAEEAMLTGKVVEVEPELYDV
ncbi:MAG: Gfo/Idh/MocA family oxidoreductase [Kiritimatiellia bacterium]